MPLVPVDVPPFPNVPNLPGVPPLLRNNLGVAAAPINAIAGLLGLGGLAVDQWGVFTADGSPLFVADSVLAVAFKQDYNTPDYPVEGGKFETYNKVTVPYDARVTYTQGGNSFERGKLLAAVEAAASSLDIYTVVTPDITYKSANIVHYGYERSIKSGVTLLTVEVYLKQVRIAAAPAFSSPQSASAAQKKDIGPLQGISPGAPAIPGPPI